MKHTRAALAAVVLFGALVFGASPATAAFVNFSGRILSASFSTTDAIVSDEIVSDTNVDRLTCFALSTKGGTLQLQYYPITGSPVDIYDGTATLTANRLAIVILNFNIPKARIIYTPSSAAPGDSVWIDCYAGTNGRR